jgi:hypothetical protein
MKGSMSLPVVSGARRYATTARIVPARHEGSVFASSATGLSIDPAPAGVERLLHRATQFDEQSMTLN